jgi:tyrosyl-tRNA synthetase
MSKFKYSSILKRGVAEIIAEEELVELLDSGRQLRLKQGFDPSTPDIHLGHVVGLRKLRQFQELGHKVILIVGDWTARIGDPSGQSATRPMLSLQEVEANAQTYMKQFFKVVDRDKTEVRWQSEWYNKFALEEVIKLTSKFTVAQLLAREDFNKRYNSGNPISLTEMLYPLLQGYDSVVIKADVEFGGIDQKFNCLLGRELQQSMAQPPQQVFLVPLLVGTDGHHKMSKSLGNHIGIDEPPDEIYGKVMSIPDSLIIDYFELATDVSEEEIAKLKEQLNEHTANPMNLKKSLAYELVKQFHNEEAAAEAQECFVRVFQRRETPEQIQTIELRDSISVRDELKIEVSRDITSLLLEANLVKSRAEAKRLLSQGAIEIDGKKANSNLVVLKDGSIIKVGKRGFLKMVDSKKRKWETANLSERE